MHTMNSKCLASVSRRRHSGLTIIEILIGLAIVGILGALAYPSYKDKVISSRRADARTALSDLATKLEAHYSRTNTYATATIATGTATDVLSIAKTGPGYYQLAIDTGATTASYYKINATPQGAQALDTKCGTLVLDSRNVKTVTGTAPAATCW